MTTKGETIGATKAEQVLLFIPKIAGSDIFHGRFARAVVDNSYGAVETTSK